MILKSNWYGSEKGTGSNMPPWPPLPQRWLKNRHWAREFSRLTFSRGREKLLRCPLAKYTHFSLHGWQRSRAHLFTRKRAWNTHTAEPPETGGRLISESRAQGVPVRFLGWCFVFVFVLKRRLFEKLFSCQKTKGFLTSFSSYPSLL